MKPLDSRSMGWLPSILLIGFLVLSEASLAASIAHPAVLKRLPKDVYHAIRKVYARHFIRVIQVESDCSQYDSELTYTLKPGSCTFSGAEFQVGYRINRLGIRASESALHSPDIIVLGDSVAMGWGVQQNETYSAIIEQQTGMKVLNAAVSSYATVREMRMLDRLDTSNLKFLIIHYMNNDFEENEFFFTHHNTLKITSEAAYQRIQQQYLSGRRYFPGKYMTGFLLQIYRKLKEKVTSQDKKIQDLQQAAFYFVNALMHGSQKKLDGIKVIVLGDHDFVQHLRIEISRPEYPEYVRHTSLVDDTVSDDMRYMLDDHWNRKGYQWIAEKILASLVVT